MWQCARVDRCRWTYQCEREVTSSLRYKQAYVCNAGKTISYKARFWLIPIKWNAIQYIEIIINTKSGGVISGRLWDSMRALTPCVSIKLMCTVSDYQMVLVYGDSKLRSFYYGKKPDLWMWFAVYLQFSKVRLTLQLLFA